jgi:uncharacterized membrane protein
MDHKPLVSSALAAALGLGLGTAQAHGDQPGQQRCYGVAKAGQNDCANLSETHGCAGEAATDHDPAEWKHVPKGACKKLGGKTEAQAKAAFAKAKAKPKD